METLEQLLERHVDEMQGVVGEYIDVTAKRHHDESVAWDRANVDSQIVGWIAVGERLPDSRQHVIAFYTNEHGKGRTSVCQYIAHATVLAEDFLSDDAEGCDVYDEERDCYWVDSGWWEASWEAETNWRITSTVTHWQPLPDAPGGKE